MGRTEDVGHIQGATDEFSCVAFKIFSKGPLD